MSTTQVYSTCSMGHTEIVPDTVVSSKRSLNTNHEKKIAQCIQYIKLLSCTVIIFAALCMSFIGVLLWHIVQSGFHPAKVQIDANAGVDVITRLELASKVCARDITNLQSEVGTQKEELDKLKTKYINLTASQVQNDCAGILSSNTTAESGVYQIHPTALIHALDVYCDMTTRGGGWIVFQRRKNGSENFDRTWADYKNGFGKLDHEFWLGLETIHNLVLEGKWEMLVNMMDNSIGIKYALYQKFEIDSEGSGYMLTVGNYTGDVKDSMESHNGMKFTTKDMDNDLKPDNNCAVANEGAWWYHKCLHSALNKPYGEIRWNTFSASIEFVEMKIRRIV